LSSGENRKIAIISPKRSVENEISYIEETSLLRRRAWRSRVEKANVSEGADMAHRKWKMAAMAYGISAMEEGGIAQTRNMPKYREYQTMYQSFLLLPRENELIIKSIISVKYRRKRNGEGASKKSSIIFPTT